MQVLRTGYEIYTGLGRNLYQYLVNKYDFKRRERGVTTRTGRKLEPRRCAACGRYQHEVLRLEAAHISPLSECARTTENNLILLCKEEAGKTEPGCHSLFDNGYASIKSIRECRENWVKRLRPVYRQRMLKLRHLYGPSALQQGHLRKELAYLRKLQSEQLSKSEVWSLLQIRIAEITRRRTKKNALNRAMAELDEVTIRNLSSPAQYARYYYEMGYINLLSGRLETAFSDFLSGRKALDKEISKPSNRWRWAAHTCLIAQVSRLLRASGLTTGWTWSKINKELNKALNQAQIAMDETKATNGNNLQNVTSEEYRHASRWVQNSYLHLVKPAIARNHIRKCQEYLKLAEKKWESMDVSSGWDAGFRPTQLSLYGQVTLLSADTKEQLQEALSYLVRSMVLLIGYRRQQPEGIRDVLYSIAFTLKQLDDSVNNQVARIAERCGDFSSWLNPFVI